MDMCKKIAKAFGVDEYDIKFALSRTGATIVGKGIAKEALNLIPIKGQIIKAGVSGTVTKALGEALIQYYKYKSPYR